MSMNRAEVRSDDQNDPFSVAQRMVGISCRNDLYRNNNPQLQWIDQKITKTEKKKYRLNSNVLTVTYAETKIARLKLESFIGSDFINLPINTKHIEIFVDPTFIFCKTFCLATGSIINFKKSKFPCIQTSDTCLLPEGTIFLPYAICNYHVLQQSEICKLLWKFYTEWKITTEDRCRGNGNEKKTDPSLFTFVEYDEYMVSYLNNSDEEINKLNDYISNTSEDIINFVSKEPAPHPSFLGKKWYDSGNNNEIMSEYLLMTNIINQSTYILDYWLWVDFFTYNSFTQHIFQEPIILSPLSLRKRKSQVGKNYKYVTKANILDQTYDLFFRIDENLKTDNLILSFSNLIIYSFILPLLFVLMGSLSYQKVLKLEQQPTVHSFSSVQKEIKFFDLFASVLKKIEFLHRILLSCGTVVHELPADHFLTERIRENKPVLLLCCFPQVNSACPIKGVESNSKISFKNWIMTKSHTRPVWHLCVLFVAPLISIVFLSLKWTKRSFF